MAYHAIGLRREHSLAAWGSGCIETQFRLSQVGVIIVNYLMARCYLISPVIRSATRGTHGCTTSVHGYGIKHEERKPWRHWRFNSLVTVKKLILLTRLTVLTNKTRIYGRPNGKQMKKRLESAKHRPVTIDATSGGVPPPPQKSS